MNYTCTQLGAASVTEIGFKASGNIEIPNGINDSALTIIDNAANKYNVEIISVNGTFNMAHPDPKIRREGVDRFKNFAESTRKLGSKYASLCSGTRNPDYLWSPHPDNDTETAWNDMIDTMKKVVDIAERNDLIVAVETEAANVINTPEKARQLMDEIGSPNLKMIIDCANIFHVGQAHKENVRPQIKKAFENFGKDIVMAHGKDISDSDGIDYCPTGEGIVDYDYFLQSLKNYNYNGDMLLHSIYIEEKMPGGYKFIKQYIDKYYGI
jgi:sugar phosphate isomerase/epimerase